MAMQVLYRSRLTHTYSTMSQCKFRLLWFATAFNGRDFHFSLTPVLSICYHHESPEDTLGEILELCKHTIRQRGTTENPKGNGGKSLSTVPRNHSQRAEDMVDKAVNSYLQLSSDTYEALLRQMPEKQRMVFLAIAAEGRAKNISGGKFVHKYHLPSPSSVISAIKGLLEKDFITHDGDEYFVYDQFFQLWTERL